MISSNSITFIQNNENSKAYWMFDILWIIKAASEQTENSFSLIEQLMPFNSGPPPHYHKSMDEMFYILEGEMVIWIDKKIYKLNAGSFARIPKGSIHYFKITSATPCRALNMYSPGGFEKGIERNAQRTHQLTLPPTGLPYMGSTDKNDMHESVEMDMIDLIAWSRQIP